MSENKQKSTFKVWNNVVAGFSGDDLFFDFGETGL